MSIESKRVVWMEFARGAMEAAINIKVADVTVFAVALADKMTAQWDLRFGDSAFLLEGQTECAACHKPLPEGSEFAASLDGVKFCNVPCLKASGREE